MAPRSARCGDAFAWAAIVFGLVARIAFAARPAHADGDTKRGELLYQACQSCHSLDQNGVGPMHRGVVGRIAGTVAGYHYSPALKNANITWTEQTLDQWLADPRGLVPGTSMFYQVANPKDRADLIAFLKERAR